MYISKVGKVHVTKLTTANDWVQVLTPAQAKGIRGYKIKTRLVQGESQKFFDYAFNDSPAENASTDGNGFWSNSGAGAGDAAGPTKGIWARVKEANIYVEVVVYE